MDEELTPQAAEEAASLFKSQKGNPLEWDWLSGMWSWFQNIWAKLWELAEEAARAVWSWVGPWVTAILDWVSSLASEVAQFHIYLWDTVSDVVGSWAADTWDWIESLWLKIKEAVASLGVAVAEFHTDLWNNIAAGLTSLGGQIATWATELPKAIERTIIDPILDWVTNAWQWFVNFITEDLITGVARGFEWLTTWVMQFAGNIIEAIVGYIGKVGRIDPTNAPTVAGGLMTLVGAGVLGLSAMTIAGELMHPLKEIGMGHVSAMIGDVVNYKAVSGAFMGALVGAALTTPLRYYFNYVLRPWLPDRRVMDMSMSRELFSQPETLVEPEWVEPIKALVGPDPRAFERRMLGYHGFADEWFPVYKELANTPVGYFALAGIARTGVFEPGFFTESIQRAGYSPRLKREFYKMFEYMAKASAQTLYIGDPINAFKEGWFSEGRLSRELVECGVPEASLPRYVHAAWIKYEVDLLSDRLSGIRDAYRKGLVDDLQFTASLTGWGMVEERATEHLSREQVRRYGIPKPPPVYYETAEGRIRVDTVRRLWRVGEIGDATLVRQLVGYEMPESMAEAILETEKARKLKPPEE